MVHALFTHGTALTKVQLHKHVCAPCMCGLLSSSLLRVHGCVAVLARTHLKQVVPALAPTLCHNMKNAALGNKKYFANACHRIYAQLHKSFLGISAQWKYGVREALDRYVDDMLDAA